MHIDSRVLKKGTTEKQGIDRIYTVNPKRADWQIPVTNGMKLHMTPTNYHIADKYQ